jgi:hypothetical protein
MSWPVAPSLLVLVFSAAVAPAMTITIIPDTGLQSNAAALASITSAANTWAALFSDPIDVLISVSLSSMSSSTIIGSTSTTLYTGSYDTIRNAMVADAADEAADAIVASLPTWSQFSATVASGDTLSGNMLATSATLKALGFTVSPAVDGTIVFNSDFSFAYSSADLTSTTMDLYTVALHEIGHVLGFTSDVDLLDSGATTSVSPSALDLFRFASGSVPTTAAEFTAASRDLTPGSAASFSDTDSTWAMSVGAYSGDRQASHWLDDASSGTYIGVMDPTLSYGVSESITAADLRALDLIGYDLATPEPGTLAMLAGSLAFLFVRRRALGRRRG